MRRVQQSFIGTGRSAHSFTSNTGVKYHSFGTPSHLYVCLGGANADITPIRTSITTSGTFAQGGSTRIQVSTTNHGANVGDYFIAVSSTTIGGNLVFNNAQYEVVSATKMNLYLIQQ